MGTAAMGRICIVDDDDAVRDSLAVFLEACGYAVVCFASALTMLHGDVLGDSVCLLVDMHMPAMNGLELLAIVRDRGMETPAILVTAAADAALRTKAKSLGAACLDKPVDGDTLLETIVQVCRA